MAGSRITNIGGDWGQMRTGVLTRAIYVAPRQRNRGGDRRPNLAGMLMDRAMQPALDDKEGEILHALEAVVDDLANKAGF